MAVRIHQLTPTLSWGDAVGNLVRLLRGWFDAEGAGGRVFAGRTDERSRGEALSADELLHEVARGDLVLVHHSIQSRFVPLLKRVAKRARVAVVFHNVTPPSLIEPFDPPLARACAAGLEELRELAEVSELGLAFSEFSARDLREAGFRASTVVPFPVDYSALDADPEPTLKAELSDGCTNLLFVGRGAPNKRLEEILRVFTAYQRLYNPRSRLVIAGGLDREHPYGAWVHGVRDALSPERVHLLGRVGPSQLAACYATASVYLSMSAHEGFGVPLVEAMHRGVPVVAFGAAAVPETLAGAGWCCTNEDPVVIAQLLAVLDRRPELRAAVRERGLRRARDFDLEHTRGPFLDALRPLTGNLR